jgi:hypothetical protein
VVEGEFGKGLQVLAGQSGHLPPDAKGPLTPRNCILDKKRLTPEPWEGFQHIIYLKTYHDRARRQWFTPATLATWKSEMGMMRVPGQAGQKKFVRSHLNRKKAGHDGALVIPAMAGSIKQRRIVVQAGLGKKRDDPVSKTIRAQGAGGVAHAVKHLPCSMKSRVQIPE